MTVRILTGDCRDVLRTLPDESVHCVVTSPPYWGLRDYQVAGQLGLERLWPEYVEHVVAIFREVRRVLRHDGTLWLNLGDCYATGAVAVGEHPGGGKQGARWAGSSPERGERCRALRDGSHAGKHTAIAAIGPMTQPNRLPQPGLKPKDLVGMPWRVAFALQADGWWLRQNVVWHKLQPMPENVEDRPTTAHEFVFLLSRSRHYFYDAEAVKEPVTGGAHRRKAGPNSRARVDRVPGARKAATGPKSAAAGSGIKANESFHAAGGELVDTRNLRSVWSLGTEPLRDEHFAAFPTRLVEPCILAGCPAGGTVLDPFGGAGTTGLVADRLGRDAILIELNPAYAAMAERRIAAARSGPVERARLRHVHKPADHGPLFAPPLQAAE